MKKKQVEKEQNNEKQLPRQETTLGEDIFQLLLKIVLIILSCIIDWTSVLCPVILQYLRKMAEQPQAGS